MAACLSAFEVTRTRTSGPKPEATPAVSSVQPLATTQTSNSPGSTSASRPVSRRPMTPASLCAGMTTETTIGKYRTDEHSSPSGFEPLVGNLPDLPPWRSDGQFGACASDHGADARDAPAAHPGHSVGGMVPALPGRGRRAGAGGGAAEGVAVRPAL